jgi:DNA-binding transcriptional MerR regulator
MSDNNGKCFLRSAELARMTGVSTDTLRHYERKGLLAPRRSPNGYREYSVEAVARVQLVQSALSVGFTLDELSNFLKTRDEGGVPCHQVRALAANKLEALEIQIRKLVALRDYLHSLLKTWDKKLAQTPKGERAWLLEAWSGDLGQPVRNIGHSSSNEIGKKRPKQE